jgi:hypothetical protein
MYREYLLNISDYFSLLSKKEASFEFIPPCIIGIIAFIYSFNGLSLYEVVVEIVHILEVLLGFLLAALALFVTINTEKVKLLKEYKVDKHIIGETENINLYRYVIIEFSYLIFVVTALCIGYLIGLIIPYSNDIFASVINSIFIIISFHVLFAIVRTLTSLSFILQKE